MAKKAAAATNRTVKKPAAATTAAVKKKPAARAEQMKKPASTKNAPGPAPALQDDADSDQEDQWVYDWLEYREDCLGLGVKPESFLRFLGPLFSLYLALKNMFAAGHVLKTQSMCHPGFARSSCTTSGCLSEPETLQPEDAEIYRIVGQGSRLK